MRAVVVCVDMWDLASLTLRWNAHHFESVMVVTSPSDIRTRDLCHSLRDEGLPIDTYVTDSFYANNALFNKWRALEEALDFMGRFGWLCIMDIDVLWPKMILEGFLTKELEDHFFYRGYLYTPRRRMCCTIPQEVPAEETWKDYPLHHQEVEWAGYSQIFHADDEVLAPPPWHDINYTSAGTADSFFQAKWPKERKIRPGFEVLHLGESGVNWCGRTTAYADGTLPEGAELRAKNLRDMLNARRGKVGDARFEHERLK